MPTNNLEHLIKRTLDAAAEEIQPNPDEKNKVLRLIQAKESSKMRKNKKFTKRAIIVVAAVICLSATTALAAGGTLNSWVSSGGLNDPTYSSVQDIMSNQDDFNFTPYIADQFSNGYQFKTAYIDKFDGKDADNNTICTIKTLDVNYQNADQQQVQMVIEKIPTDVVNPDTTVYKGSSQYNGITINYSSDPYKCVSTDYVPTAEEKAQEAAGQLFISVDSDTHHEPQYYKVNGVSWNFNGVHYLIWGFDYETSLTETELYQMAQQIIDLQQAK